MTNNLSKFYVIFDDATTDAILSYIRRNIFKKYPYKSLSNSSLLSNIRLEKEEIDKEYITAWNGNKLYPYKYNIIFNLYYKDDFISSLNNIEAKAYDSKRNEDYLKDRARQNVKFK